jgi:hypothetical protein
MRSKRNKQKVDSMTLVGLGLFGIVVVVFALAISNLLTNVSSPVQGPVNNYWVPTNEDILYQDSMYQIIKDTENNMDTINIGMARIIKKLDIIIYRDGSSDSVKLYEDSHVTNYNTYTDEDVMWIGGNGDIIYE